MEIVRRARSRQARFEWLRTRSFPWTWNRRFRCDERVGRFCLTHDADHRPPGEEPEEVRREREGLIDELELASVSLPGDGWIAGQRVRYLVEAGRHRDALSAAASCRAQPPWWCRALSGYAFLAAGLPGRAEFAFAEALRLMPPDERCRWRDISLFLKGEVRRSYRRLRCGRRGGVEARFWWLADPLWSQSGNDRRLEHLARHVIDRMQTDARSAFGVPWGADLRELLLRYGWPGRWERRPSNRVDLAADPSIVSHDPPAIRCFLPPSRLLEDPASIRSDEWSLEPPRPFSGYAPRHLAGFDTLAHQFARFRSGDSVVLVGAYDVGSDSGWVAGPVRAALMAARSEEASPAAVIDDQAPLAGALRVAFPSRSVVASLEVLSRAQRRAARARYGIPAAPRNRFVAEISDLLITRAVDPPPTSLDEAIPLARGSLRAPPGERLGLYWEVYGLSPAGEKLSVAFTLRREGRSWLRALAETVGLAGGRPAVRLEWEESTAAGEVTWRRGLSVQLPELKRGPYVLRVEVGTRGRETMAAERRLIIQ
ncbi:MAG: hypothetical protein ACE5JR_03855 [Gemmatimonadota bacterium]